MQAHLKTPPANAQSKVFKRALKENSKEKWLINFPVGLSHFTRLTSHNNKQYGYLPNFEKIKFIVYNKCGKLIKPFIKNIPKNKQLRLQAIVVPLPTRKNKNWLHEGRFCKYIW